jgi:hypothetical protein
MVHAAANNLEYRGEIRESVGFELWQKEQGEQGRRQQIDLQGVLPAVRRLRERVQHDAGIQNRVVQTVDLGSHSIGECLDAGVVEHVELPHFDHALTAGASFDVCFGCFAFGTGADA